ncbi:hypothetical protein FQN60_016737 [Etheostoma spectabile]|uniref:CCHC-type domain-containing protein n=1 Tax=Etheostoma spectabile TaxID=54343 RepID=A0A5J5D5N9_9PERO|nr:hypothetical protein FQN60_016737 [Etheostoma spectabile]
MRARHLGPLDQAYFIFDHLEGVAKDEIRELKRLVRDDAALSLLDVRAEAIRWELEGKPNGGDQRHSVPSFCAVQNSRVQGHVAHSPTLPATPQLAELVAMMKKQQDQINQLSQNLLQMQPPPRPHRFNRPSNVICRRCQQPGHYARDCENERVPSRSNSFVRTPPAVVSTISQQAEN